MEPTQAKSFFQFNWTQALLFTRKEILSFTESSNSQEEEVKLFLK